MIDRYSRPEMSKIWDINSKFDYYLQVELAVCDAYVRLGYFPEEDIKKVHKILYSRVKIASESPSR